MKIEHLMILDQLPQYWIIKETATLSGCTYLTYDVGLENTQVNIIIYHFLYPSLRNGQFFPTNAIAIFSERRSTDVLLTSGQWLFDDRNDITRWNQIWPESKHFEIMEYIE